MKKIYIWFSSSYFSFSLSHFVDSYYKTIDASKNTSATLHLCKVRERINGNDWRKNEKEWIRHDVYGMCSRALHRPSECICEKCTDFIAPYRSLAVASHLFSSFCRECLCVSSCKSVLYFLSDSRIVSHAHTVQNQIHSLIPIDLFCFFFCFFSFVVVSLSFLFVNLETQVHCWWSVRCVSHVYEPASLAFVHEHKVSLSLMYWTHTTNENWIGWTEMKWNFLAMIMAANPCVVCFFSLFHTFGKWEWKRRSSSKKWNDNNNVVAYLSCPTQQCAYSPYSSSFVGSETMHVLYTSRSTTQTTNTIVGFSYRYIYKWHSFQ